MSARTFVDTGALFALASPRDQYHAKALAIWRRYVDSGVTWVGTTLVLGELHGRLVHHLGPERARNILAGLVQDRVYLWLEVSAQLVGEALDRWLARFHDQRFSLTDAVSFEVMRREGITAAFGFDHDFVTAGFELLR